MFTLIGLANEAGRDRFARHALGARFLDFVWSRGGFGPWENRGEAETARGTLEDIPVTLLRQTQGKLHQCGEVLTPHLLDQANPKRIIVAHDEASWPIGQAYLESGMGEGGGHLGLKSLIEKVGTGEFARLQIGIDHILRDRSEFEEFFNAELDKEHRLAVEETFPKLLEQLVEYIQEGGYEHGLPAGCLKIPDEIKLEAQLPDRQRNLPVSPVAVQRPGRELHDLNKAVTVLVRIIQKNANRYARMCHEGVGDHPLVRMLESGVPEEMLALTRKTSFHIEHLSFDFQNGKIVEINAAPLPPFVPNRLWQLLGEEAPGNILTPDLLCQRVEILARRHQLGGRRGTILLVSPVGEVELGASGWFRVVSSHLAEKGFPVEIGPLNEEAEVVWANLTWMTPDRWPSVLSQKVWSGEAYIFPSPRNFLFTSKRFLATLSSPVGRGILEVSPSDSTVLDQTIPWTKVLEDERDTIRWALSNKLRIYGKPYLSSGGRGGYSVRTMRDLLKVERPAVVQEWVDPYTIPNTDFNHDIRVVVYGHQGQYRVWEARVWEGSSTLSRPKVSPVLYR